MRPKLTRVLNLLALLLASQSITEAQESSSLPPLVSENVLTLTDAVAVLKMHLEKNPDNSSAQFQFGLLLTAKGDLASAEQAFESAATNFIKSLALSAALPNSLTVLLQERFARLNVTLNTDFNEASAYNNLGAVQALRGKLEEATEAIDKAATVQPNWGVPWANGAALWLLKHNAGEALKTGRIAAFYGEKTAKVYTVLAEASLRARNSTQADDYIKIALECDPNYSFAQAVRAQILSQRSRLPEAERALLQSLSQNTFVVNESRFQASDILPGIALGLPSEDQEKLTVIGNRGEWHSRLQFLRDRGTVEGQSGTFQRLDQSRFLFGRSGEASDTVMSLLFRRQDDARLAKSSLFLPKLSAALEQTELTAVQRFGLSPSSQVRLMAGFVRNGETVRSYASANEYQPLHDEQFRLEARWDKTLSKRADLWLGGAWLQNRRIAQTPSGDLSAIGLTAPMQPFDQVFASGTTTLWSAYARLQYRVTPKAAFAIGPVFGSAAGTPSGLFFGRSARTRAGINEQNHAAFVLPFAEWRQDIGNGQKIRLGMTPTITQSNGSLNPIFGESVTRSDDPIASDTPVANRLGARSLFFAPAGRGIRYEASYIRERPNGTTLTATAFHRKLWNVATTDGDPRLTPGLLLVPWGMTEATGVEGGATFTITPQVNLHLFGRYQEARGMIGTPDALPLLGNPNRAFSNTPRWQGRIRLDYKPTPKFWLGIEAEFVGARELTQQAIEPAPIVAVFYLQRGLPSTRRYALHGGYTLTNGAELTFSLILPERGYSLESRPETVFLVGINGRFK